MCHSHQHFVPAHHGKHRETLTSHDITHHHSGKLQMALDSRLVKPHGQTQAMAYAGPLVGPPLHHSGAEPIGSGCPWWPISMVPPRGSHQRWVHQATHRWVLPKWLVYWNGSVWKVPEMIWETPIYPSWTSWELDGSWIAGWWITTINQNRSKL